MDIKDILRARKLQKEDTRVVVHHHDQFLLEKVARPSGRETKVLHPSEISNDHFCPREVAIKERFPELKRKDVTSGLQAIFDVGTAIHEMLQNDFAEMMVLYGYYKCTKCTGEYLGFWRKVCPHCEAKHTLTYKELKIRNEKYLIGGHTDGIWIPLNKKKKYGLEIKSINDRGFGLVKGSGEPMTKHKRQALMYIDALESKTQERVDVLIEQKNKGITSASEFETLMEIEKLPFEGTLILYFNKNDSSREEYFIPKNGDSRAFMNTRYAELKPATDWLRGGEFPKCTCKNKTEGRTKGCKVFQKCFEYKEE